MSALILLTLSTNAFAADGDSVPGAEAILRPRVIVLLGEIHGTNESPAAVSRLVCAALDRGLNVTVGLELLVDDQTNIDRYLASDGGDADRDSLISGNFWQRDYQDGRASQAMVDLIESLRRLCAGHPGALKVLALDNPLAPEGRDQFMAERLASVVADDTTGIVITLTGNLHSRVELGTHFDPDYEPMGYHVWLRCPNHDVISLDLAHAPGTAWISTSEGCGVMSLGGEEGTVGIEVHPAPVGDPREGRYYIGAISASLPVKDR